MHLQFSQWRAFLIISPQKHFQGKLSAHCSEIRAEWAKDKINTYKRINTHRESIVKKSIFFFPGKTEKKSF